MLQEHVDPSLDPSTVPDPVLAVMADVALICLAEEPSQRPTMKDVVGFLEPAASYRGEGGAPAQPMQQSCLRSPREDVWGSKGVFDNPFVANPFQAGIPAAPPEQRPLSSGPLGKSTIMLSYFQPACSSAKDSCIPSTCARPVSALGIAAICLQASCSDSAQSAHLAEASHSRCTAAVIIRP